MRASTLSRAEASADETSASIFIGENIAPSPRATAAATPGENAGESGVEAFPAPFFPGVEAFPAAFFPSFCSTSPSDENVLNGNLNACACPRHLPSYPPNAISTPSPPAVSTAHTLMPSPAVDGDGSVGG